jgi:cysteine-rich repeat protein
MVRAIGLFGIVMVLLVGCLGDDDHGECSRCGDGNVDSGEQCDDGNIYAGDGCSASCQIEPRCGDSLVTAGEACDDGNTADGDSCESDCTLPACGNAIVDGGEQCDDGNSVDADGCKTDCTRPPFSTTPPTIVSGTMTGCTTAMSNAGRKVGIDGNYNAYVVMSCGGVGYATKSVDHGFTWSAPQPLGISQVVELAVQGGPQSVVYVAATTQDARLLFARSDDGGATWSQPVQLAADVGSTQVSMAINGDTIFVQASTFSVPRRLFRNTSRGVGTFATTDIMAAAVFHDVLVDDSGHVWSAGDDPTFRLMMSSDGGATFGAEINPAGTAYYSDWGYGAGKLFATGSNGDIAVIPIAAPMTSTTVIGLETFDVYPDRRALSADSSGTAYIATQQTNGDVTLDRLAPNSTMLDSSMRRTLGVGTSVGIVAVSDKAAIVIYTANGQVIATVQSY